MDKLIESVRKEIYDYYSKNKFFTENTFAQACYNLTRTYEMCFMDTLNPKLSATGKSEVLQPMMLGSYRQMLKDAFRFCKNDDETINKVVLPEALNIANEEMVRANTFNDIRNLFERVELNVVDAEIEGKQIKFSMKNSYRGINAELYSRWVDKKKPLETENTFKSLASQTLYTQLSDLTVTRYWNILGQTPAKNGKNYFKKLIKWAKQKIIDDAEVKDQIEFSNFTLDEFRAVYSVLLALGIMNFNYVFTCRVKNEQCFSLSDSVVFKKKTDLIKLLLEFTSLDENKILYILELLTYDPQYHADKTTIYQPLFEFGENYFYSPLLVFNAFAQDKLIAVLKSKQTEEPAITRIAKTRENVMTDEILDVIEDESQLLFHPNFKIIENNETKAEYDILLYDEASNCLLLTELKWYFKIDGESDQVRMDSLKLKKAIAECTKRQKRFQTDAKKYLLEALDVQTESEPKIMSCIVSRNNSGSSYLQDDIPVFDQFIFISALQASEFKLDRFFHMMLTHNYLPDMDKHAKYIDYKIKYAGYEISYPKLTIARNA